MNASACYLDHNATTPLWPEAHAAMLEALEMVGNPSSLHAFGRESRTLIDQAREQIANLLHVPSLAIVFTGGGAEANGLGLSQAQNLGAGRLLVGAGKHNCILQHAAVHPLPKRVIALDNNGRLDLDDLEIALKETSLLPFLACMAEKSKKKNERISAKNSNTK